MSGHEQVCHAALAGVHVTLAAVLALQGELLHSGCVLCAAIVYLIMALRRRMGG